MDRVMVRVSSAKGFLSGRLSPKRGYAMSTAHPMSQTSFSFQTFVYLLFALCGVFLVAHFVFTASESSTALRSSLRSLPAEAMLHAQLLDKEREIEKLKWEIDQIRKGVTVKASNINQKEGVIQQLKSKARDEHDAKTKAELALSDRAGALHECQQQKTALAGEVAQCHFDLQALLGGGGRSAARTVSQQSTAALGEMTRRQQELQRSSGEAEEAAGTAFRTGVVGEALQRRGGEERSGGNEGAAAAYRRRAVA